MDESKDNCRAVQNILVFGDNLIEFNNEPFLAGLCRLDRTQIETPKYTGGVKYQSSDFPGSRRESQGSGDG